MSSKQARHIQRRWKHALRHLPGPCHSLTCDNGTEFTRIPLLEKHTTIRVYFAEAGCPYQRGTNENTNGLLRQAFPKGLDFRTVTHAEVQRYETLLNNRPRAGLGFATPNEVFLGKAHLTNCDSD